MKILVSKKTSWMDVFFYCVSVLQTLLVLKMGNVGPNHLSIVVIENDSYCCCN